MITFCINITVNAFVSPCNGSVTNGNIDDYDHNDNDNDEGDVLNCGNGKYSYIVNYHHYDYITIIINTVSLD